MDIQTKICCTCKIEKNIECYSKDKIKKDGLRAYCRTCDSKKKKQYRQENAERERERNKKYYQENLEKVRERSKKYRQENAEREREYSKQYYQENKEKTNKYRLERLKTNPKFKLDHNMSRSICKSLKRKGLSKKETGWQKSVGYTLEQLKEHLEKQFTPEMTWDNHGTLWHIDHIKPKSLFEYDSIDHPEFKKCWSLDNLQPLEAKENLKKNNKYTEPNGDNHGISEYLEFVQRQANPSI